MSWKINKSLCVWVVSPKDGSIRRISLVSPKALIGLVIVALVVGAAVFVAGDYTQLQIKRARDFFTLRRLGEERESLFKTNRALARRIRDLESVNAQVKDYEKNVRARVAELASVLKMAESFGVVEKDDLHGLDPAEGSARGGVGGGVDLKCLGSRKQCGSLKDISWTGSDGEVSFGRFEGYDGQRGLLVSLDKSLRLLKSLPLRLPVEGRKTSRYGIRRSPFSGRWQMHGGMDIAAPRGAKVYCPAEGIVRSVKRDRHYGIVVDVVHSNHVVTRYGHMSAAKVVAGQRVTSGTLIGLVGSTGRSTGPHLHYEVLVKGKAKDPEKLLALGKLLNRTVL